jgi:glutamyl-tRNA(Gln) amidotransferase subunit E
LLEISKRIQEKNWRYNKNEDKRDITLQFLKCKSKIIQNAIKKNHKIFSISFKNMAGMFGYSPYEGIRLGKEVAELVRFFGIGGVFHSDELPNYGIEESDLENMKKFVEINENDAFLILACPEEKMHTVVDQIILRIEYIKDHGIPIDTRLSTVNGETKFLRPRPGAARMYPETDIPPIIISKKELENAKKNIPKSWDDSISELQIKFEINSQLAEQIFDSRYIELFENIIQKRISQDGKADATFTSSILCSTIPSLERKGLNSKLLKSDEIEKAFQLLDKGKIAKESIGIIFENIMAGKSKTTQEAMKNTSIEAVNESDLEEIIKKIVENNQEIVKNQKERAAGPLMGIAMKELRGKASGEMVNNLLLKNIKKMLENI